ncbi:hypothetical protein VNO77_27792 [Canavalia gladiata]|uniref:Uncharacterized protein n=1 Tax=Canavalia gladiata TaxID=3824 RepID=A0AAN9Q6U0_CANGL
MGGLARSFCTTPTPRSHASRIGRTSPFSTVLTPASLYRTPVSKSCAQALPKRMVSSLSFALRPPPESIHHTCPVLHDPHLLGPWGRSFCFSVCDSGLLRPHSAGHNYMNRRHKNLGISRSKICGERRLTYARSEEDLQMESQLGVDPPTVARRVQGCLKPNLQLQSDDGKKNLS